MPEAFRDSTCCFRQSGKGSVSYRLFEVLTSHSLLWAGWMKETGQRKRAILSLVFFVHLLCRILGRCETHPFSLGATGGGHAGGHSALDLPRPSCWGPERQSGPGREVWEYAGAWCLLSRKGK